MKIGFIGLGIMGTPMAKNLIAAGHDLVVRGHNPATLAELTSLGATEAATPKAVAEQVELVLTMLPNSPQVIEVVLGADGVLEGAHAGLAYIDMSSIAPLASREIAEALSAHHIPMLDAPVSGGEPKAIDGTLSFMVGGPQDLFDKYTDVLTVMGASVVRVGEMGAGNIAKLANQIVVAVNIAAVSEALVFAQKAGVEPAAVLAAIRGGLAGSTVMDAKGPMMLDRNFAPGFRVELHTKDLTNAIETGHSVGAPVPLTAAMLEMMTALKVAGHERDDHSVLVQYYEMLAATELTREQETE
jgi:2-hydroxy-3-oxopropionate reductase